jgi:hypothetical protein
VWRPWTHCALFDGVPLPGVWGCTGYYPSLALRQFGGVQYPPRLGDLDAVITPFLPTGFSRVSARKTRQPEPSRPVPTRAHHLKYSQKEGPGHISQGLTKFD